MFRKVFSYIKRQRGGLQAKTQDLLNLPVELKPGVWRGNDRLFWQNSADRLRVEKLFYSLISDHNRSQTKSFKTYALKVLGNLSRFGIRTQITSNTIKGSSVVYFARGESVKCFDFDNCEVITIITKETAARLNRARMLPMFEVFPINDFTIDEDSKSNRGLCVKREALIDRPCIGNLPRHEQLMALKTICALYAKYHKLHSKPPAYELLAPCFDEVVNCLNPVARAQCLLMKDAYLDFIRITPTIPAHLDFNIGNFLAGDNMLLLDIEDAGLLLPVSFDINNLVLNEVYERRSTHLLLMVMRKPSEIGYESFIRSENKNISKHMKTSLFANFILRESRYVAEELFKKWDSKAVQHNWDKFAKAIPGWPFINNDL